MEVSDLVLIFMCSKSLICSDWASKFAHCKNRKEDATPESLPKYVTNSDILMDYLALFFGLMVRPGHPDGEQPC